MPVDDPPQGIQHLGTNAATDQGDVDPAGGIDVDLLIQQNSLAKGEVSLNRGPVRLKDIRCPYLNVICNQDTIVPPASSEPLTALVGSDDATELRLKSGHGGLVAGR